jgi:hypothetical protein
MPDDEPAKPEPSETGSQDKQETAPVDPTIERFLSPHKLEAHPLPSTLRDLADAFRSHPAWLLLTNWTQQITAESERLKIENKHLRDQLETESIEHPPRVPKGDRTDNYAVKRLRLSRNTICIYALSGRPSVLRSAFALSRIVLIRL